MDELIHKLGIDWKLLLANAVTFLIVFWVLRRYAFGPIIRLLDQRRDMAANTVKDNQAAQAALAGADEQHKEIIAEARQQSGQILVQARGEAEQLKQRMVSEAKAAAEQIAEEMRADMRQERQRVMHEAKRDLATLVVTAAGRLVEREAGDEFDRQAAKEVLQEVEKIS